VYIFTEAKSYIEPIGNFRSRTGYEYLGEQTTINVYSLEFWKELSVHDFKESDKYFIETYDDFPIDIVLHTVKDVNEFFQLLNCKT
jgi:hypothetical protein